jgi:hypothetical protein
VAPPSWRAIADAVGHSVLVFVFVPTLAALPGWLRYEFANPLVFTDPMVTVFTPVRGLRALLNGFDEGMNAGLLAGLLNGVLVCAWAWSRGAPATRRQRLLLGAGGGAVAGALMAATMLAIHAVRAGELVIPFVPVAFEIGSGVVCGVVAGPTMLRLLAPGDTAPLAAAPAPGARAAARR